MTRPQPRTVARLLAAPIGAVLVLSACAPIQSIEPYAASDGVRTVINDDVIVENLMIISAAEGEPGAVQGGIRNDGAATSVAIGDQSVPIGAGETVLLGGENGIDVTIESVSVRPGATLTLTVAVDGGDAQEVPIPVLDGTLSEYEPLLPDASDED